MALSYSRALWSKETEFSDWLHSNIETIGTVVRLRLIALQREAAVGPFRADLVARIEDSDDFAIIENQLGNADHKHFGQLMTYAGHYKAAAVIWIAYDFCSEYRRAIRWLNNLSLTRFYAVTMNYEDHWEAPHFRLVSGPADSFGGGQETPLEESEPSALAHDGQRAAMVPSPFEIASPRSISPGQLVVNGLFERISLLLSENALFRRRKIAAGKNWYAFALGPVPRSEWSVVFTSDRARLELVFNDAATARDDLSRMVSYAPALESRIGSPVHLRLATSQKQKAIIYYPITWELWDDPDQLATICVSTITKFAEAVRDLDIFS